MEIELYLETAAAVIGLEVDQVFVANRRKGVCHELSPPEVIKGDICSPDGAKRNPRQRIGDLIPGFAEFMVLPTASDRRLRNLRSVLRDHRTAVEQQQAIGELVVHANPRDMFVDRNVASDRKADRRGIVVFLVFETDIKIVRLCRPAPAERVSAEGGCAPNSSRAQSGDRKVNKL
jgi:hypothetical protein